MAKYRSKFELSVASILRKKKLGFQYEAEKFHFIQPAKHRTYTPDFKLLNSGIFVESKGKLTAEERNKLLWIKEQHKNLPFVLLFMRAKNPIRKGSPTSYGTWASKNGFIWFDWETDKEGFIKYLEDHSQR